MSLLLPVRLSHPLPSALLWTILSPVPIGFHSREWGAAISVSGSKPRNRSQSPQFGGLRTANLSTKVVFCSKLPQALYALHCAAARILPR